VTTLASNTWKQCKATGSAEAAAATCEGTTRKPMSVGARCKQRAEQAGGCEQLKHNQVTAAAQLLAADGSYAASSHTESMRLAAAALVHSVAPWLCSRLVQLAQS
jgi:hypothetical protein